MKIDDFMKFFQICHSTDQPVHEQHIHNFSKNMNVRRQTKSKMPPTKNVQQLIVVKIPEGLKTTTPSSVLDKKIIVVHAKVMGLTCCDNPFLVTVGTTQTIASSWDQPLIALDTEPHEGDHNRCDHCCSY